MKFVITIFLMSLISQFTYSQQDSVDVTFYYYPTDNPSTVYLRGEFNGWSLDNPMNFSKVP